MKWLDKLRRKDDEAVPRVEQTAAIASDPDSATVDTDDLGKTIDDYDAMSATIDEDALGKTIDDYDPNSVTVDAYDPNDKTIDDYEPADVLRKAGRSMGLPESIRDWYGPIGVQKLTMNLEDTSRIVQLTEDGVLTVTAGGEITTRNLREAGDGDWEKALRWVFLAFCRPFNDSGEREEQTALLIDQRGKRFCMDYRIAYRSAVLHDANLLADRLTVLLTQYQDQVDWRASVEGGPCLFCEAGMNDQRGVCLRCGWGKWKTAWGQSST